MGDILRGLHLPPLAVSLARGLLEALVMGGLIALAAAVSTLDLSVFGIPTTFSALGIAGALWLIRVLEGLADQIDPEKTSKP